MNYQINYFILVLLLLSAIGCNEESPVVPPLPEPPKAVYLSLVDVSCTEAFIKVTAADSVLPLSISLTKDASTIANFTLAKTDTVIVDTTLQPNQTYTYQTIEEINGNEEKSDTLQVKSLKITSNNFNWTTYTFGDPDGGSSSLRDIVIINDNNIWAVGEIYNDTTGIPYNAVHWDGTQWSLLRIPYLYQGDSIYNPIQSIYAFNPQDIWFCGNGIINWDGSQYIPINVPANIWGPYQMNKIWEMSDNNVYVVGDSGKIAHFNGQNWNRIESGTTANLRDVYGVDEPTTGNLKILATAEKLNDYRILKLIPTTAEDTLDWQPDTHLSGIWLDGRRTYVAGTDIWVNQYNQWQKKTFTNFFFTTIRGSKSNNIYGIGPDGIVHFNGQDWQLIKQRPEGIVMLSGNCSSNLVAAVGFTTSGGVVGKAVILLANKLE